MVLFLFAIIAAVIWCFFFGGLTILDLADLTMPFGNKKEPANDNNSGPPSSKSQAASNASGNLPAVAASSTDKTPLVERVFGMEKLEADLKKVQDENEALTKLQAELKHKVEEMVDL